MRTESKPLIKLFLLGIIFVLPAFAGWFLYQYHDYFSFKTTNRGTLVHPALQRDDLALHAPAQQRWQIIFAPLQCSAATEKLMHTLHQLRVALGKDKERVILTLLTDNQCQQPEHDFRKLIFDSQQNLQLQQALKTQSTGKIYLLDPNGNLFMYYPETANAMDILKDMKKVLEVSQIG
jgi:hypothetical protein